MMKMKKLILLIALILGCTLESYAQKSTFQFRDLGNVRSWATYKANEDAGSDVIMAATYKVETNDEGGYTVTVVGFPAVFSKWYTATKDDYEWIRIKKLAPTDEKGVIAPVVKTNN